MAFDIKHLSIEEIALSILLKKKGICSVELVDKTIAFKKKLQREGKDKDLEKILLQIRAITPVVLSELIPELNKMLNSVKICSHCKKKTFFSFASCIHCNKELKLKQLFPAKREYYTTTKGEVPSCLNCRTQEWEKIPNCKSCGTSFETNKPGPDSVICKNCDKTLMFNDAICSECGTWSQVNKSLLVYSERSWFKVNAGKFILLMCIGLCLFSVRESIFLLLTGESSSLKNKKVLSEEAQLLISLKGDKKSWRIAADHIDKWKIENAIVSLSDMKQTPDIVDLQCIGHCYLALEYLAEGSIIDARKHIYKGKQLSPNLFIKIFPKQL